MSPNHRGGFRGGGGGGVFWTFFFSEICPPHQPKVIFYDIHLRWTHIKTFFKVIFYDIPFGNNF